MPNMIYAFQWCDSVFESGFEVVSLHASKVGAYRAMRDYLLRECERDREDAIRNGECYRKGWNGLRHKAWRVHGFEVRG